MKYSDQQTVCEAFSILGCDNGWTACRLSSLRKTIEGEMRPYQQGELVDEYGKVRKDKLISVLKGLVKKGYVTKREINDKPHFTLDKEAFYPY